MRNEVSGGLLLTFAARDSGLGVLEICERICIHFLWS
jgi:hypothetical protein